MFPERRRVRRSAGFTLVELLVSITVLAVILLVSTQVFGGMRTVIARTSNQVAEFREARSAFETMTRRIPQATLNAYDDLDPATATSGSTGTASAYTRASELRFISGNAAALIGNSGTTGTLPHPTQALFFQAPLGYSNSSSQSGTSSPNLVGLIQLLNTCGYFIEWNSDQSLRPAFLPASIPLRWRYRLMEMIEPTENLSVYNYTSGPDPAVTTPPLRSKSWGYTGKEWFQNALALPLTSGSQTPGSTRPAHAIASNVIFLALLPMVAPRDSADAQPGASSTPAPDGTSTDIAPNYLYDTSVKSGLKPDSRNQLPPLVRLVMIAAEEQSFARYQAARGSADPSMDLGLTNILTDASYNQRTNDIKTVTGILLKKNINYRVFSATVTLTPN